MMSSERHSSEKERRVCEWGRVFCYFGFLGGRLVVTDYPKKEGRKKERGRTLALSLISRCLFSEMSEGLRTHSIKTVF